MRWLLVIASLCLTTPARAQSVGAEARGAFARGMAAINAGHVDVAREAFARAAELAPEWGLAFLEWGIVEAAVDPKSALALECLKKAAVLSPGNPRVHYQLGLLYEQQARLADAVRELKSALALRSTMRDARYRLAQVLLLAEAREEALTMFQSLITEEPGHTGALTAIAELYEHGGKLTEAEEALLSLTRLQPQVAYHRYRLAQFYERTGNVKKAKQAFAQAEALDPRPKRTMRQLK
jgi:tetratricopeptide (TPR) repeat protein